ncbi:hypothetical protein [Aestuariivivens sediminis]|uniref:hypothetical protein n=1 Tax=Aestuariivivens sediminis TaxID=2913557 RepID=UPI001F5893B1|nr:hypothetical protein [Aestuariivivens sediminis]
MKIFTSGFLVLVLVWTPFANAQYENIRIDQEDYYQKDPASPNNASVLVNVSRNELFYDNGGNKHTRVEGYSKPIGTSDWMPSFQIITPIMWTTIWKLQNPKFMMAVNISPPH